MTLIDSISSDNLPKIKAEYEEKYNAYHEIVDELNKYGNPLEIDRNLDIIQYQIDEIEHADIQPNEEETLIEKRHKFRNAEKIINSLKGSYDVLDGYDGQNAVTQVKQAISFLNNISTFGEDISTSLDRLESVKLELKDISETLASSVPYLIKDLSALSPNTKLSESMMMDLPAPVSPLKMLSPFCNSRLNCDIKAIFLIDKDLSI